MSRIAPSVAEPPLLWPHQTQGLEDLWQAIAEGERAICVTAPAGAGKTRMIAEIIGRAVRESKGVVVYTNRRLLVSQTHGVLEDHAIDHGVMAAGWDPALTRNIQLASMQTVDRRVLKAERWDLHAGDYVVVDEAHLQKARIACEILRQHREMDAVVIGFTATPVGIGHIYNRLIAAGTMSECRACGALVPCETYGPDEPDLKLIGGDKVHYTIGEQRRAFVRHTIFGRVYDWWKRLNPDARPSILFAPGVKESRWFAEQFERRGVAAAHIDAETPDEERQEILMGSKDGSIKVICNRFVLREGINLPWLEHMILACVTGRLSTFLQMGGRPLRAYPGVEKVTLQDHSGSFWKFGSLNEDRVWKLEDDDRSIHQRRKRRVQEGKEKEPLCCPKCRKVLHYTTFKYHDGCPHCGYKFKKSVRMVVQVDGTLKRMYGQAVKRRPQKTESEKAWDGCFFAAKNAKRAFTMTQVRGWFFQKTSEPPPYGRWNCPREDSADWGRELKAVFPK